MGDKGADEGKSPDCLRVRCIVTMMLSMSHYSIMLDLARFSRLPTISRQARVVPDPILGDHYEKLV